MKKFHWIYICVSTLLSAYNIQGVSQELRYSFKEGEVIEYELLEKYGDSLPSGYESFMRWNFRFEVVAAEEDRYSMTLQILSWSNDLFSITEQTRQLKPALRSQIPIIQNMYGRLNAELINPISFTMDSKGRILTIQGFEKIQADIIQAAEETPALKHLQNFEGIEIDYGKQKYNYLISEFFPAIPENLNDTIKIETGHFTVHRINRWSNPDLVQQSNEPIQLQKTFELDMGSSESGMEDLKNTVGEMTIIWPKLSGFPTQIKYQGYVTGVFSYQIQEFPSQANDAFGQVEINSTYHTDHFSPKVFVSGFIENKGDCDLTVSLPEMGISKNTTPLKIHEDGSFEFSFDMDQKVGLIDFTDSAENKVLFKLFVKPGDSVHIKADLSNSDRIIFEGPTALEQYLLNDLQMDSSQYSGQNPEPTFSKFMEIETRYKKYTDEILTYRKSYSIPSTYRDSLNNFRKYLGNPNGYISDSYKNFVGEMVWDYMFLIHPIQESFIDFAEMLLIDWDLYWYKAFWTERYMKEDLDNGELYQQFKDLYPGTPYQKILEKIYLKSKKWQVGQYLPHFELSDLSGKSHKTIKLKDQYWGIILPGGNYKEIIGTITKAAQFNKSQDHPLKFFVYLPEEVIADSVNSAIKNADIILLPEGEANKAIADYLQDFPEQFLIMDPLGRICYHGIELLNEVMSWPLVKTEEERTIKLKVFWYSFAGAFILAVILIVAIRINAKRKEVRLKLKHKIAQLEVDAVRSRMNPHFLFNALGSIQNLVNQGKAKEASLYLARFGDLVRTILNQSSKPVIGLNEEIDMIRNYLQLEQLGFAFNFEIQIEKTIDPSTIEIPPLLIQPHVENAIIHGISSLGKEGKLVLVFRQKDNQLICEVRDNGPGYQKSDKAVKEGLGQGWKLTRQRIELMKEQYGEEVSVEISNGNLPDAQGTGIPGTTVTFRLPMQKMQV